MIHLLFVAFCCWGVYGDGVAIGYMALPTIACAYPAEALRKSVRF